MYPARGAGPDVLYVERLIAPGVINTMPQPTLKAFADHGDAGRALDIDLAEPDRTPRRRRRGRARSRRHYEPARPCEGVEAFCDSYDELLRCVESKTTAVAGTTGR